MKRLQRRVAFRLAVLTLRNDLDAGVISESGYRSACQQILHTFNVNPAPLFENHPLVTRWNSPQPRP